MHTVDGVHPMGEEKMSSQTYAGIVLPEAGDEAMTPFGGFFKRLSIEQGVHWIAEATKLIWQAVPRKFILDWDRTVQTRQGSSRGCSSWLQPTKTQS